MSYSYASRVLNLFSFAMLAALFNELFDNETCRSFFKRVFHAAKEALKGALCAAVAGLVIGALIGGRAVFWTSIASGVGFQLIWLVPIALGVVSFVAIFIYAFSNRP